MDDEFLLLSAAAKHGGLSPSKLRSVIEDGLLPTFTLPADRRVRLVRRADLEALRRPRPVRRADQREVVAEPTAA